jgi:tetratricopeptide (TPR) repeat protein
MATNKLLILALLLTSAAAWSRETASPSACQAAAAQPAIAAAQAAFDGNPNNLQASFKLADAWSDAGCFNDAVQVLQSAKSTHPANKELETRLRVARSLVGEEHFFDNLDRADYEAKLKRETFRCSTLADVDACNQALRMKPDDPTLLVAQGDALMQAKRPADAVGRYRLAAVIVPNQQDIAQKISAAESQLPAAQTNVSAPLAPARSSPAKFKVTDAGRPMRRYTNAAPDSQTH